MEKKADIIPILEGIVEENTKSYQSDFALDAERLTAAMLEPVPENRVFLWMSRPCGTWLFWEREVFLRDTRAHSTWTHPDYIAQADRIKAYRVTVAPGRPGAFVLGKLQPLNYGEQVERVKRLALPVQQVTLDFEGGKTRTMSYTDYTSHPAKVLKPPCGLKRGWNSLPKADVTPAALSHTAINWTNGAG